MECPLRLWEKYGKITHPIFAIAVASFSTLKFAMGRLSTFLNTPTILSFVDILIICI
jgi:hypothetical protein